jgi:hypothetical protein
MENVRALICKDHCLLFDAHRPRCASLTINKDLIALLDFKQIVNISIQEIMIGYEVCEMKLVGRDL